MIKIILFTFCLFRGLASYSQDTLSINQFDSLVTIQINKMKKMLIGNDTLTINEAIILVKIQNTLPTGIEKYFKNSKEFKRRLPIYRRFDSCFKIHFIEKTINLLNAKLTTGLGYYSKKYDILLGGTLNNRNSLYYIK